MYNVMILYNVISIHDVVAPATWHCTVRRTPGKLNRNAIHDIVLIYGILPVPVARRTGKRPRAPRPWRWFGKGARAWAGAGAAPCTRVCCATGSVIAARCTVTVHKWVAVKMALVMCGKAVDKLSDTISRFS